MLSPKSLKMNFLIKITIIFQFLSPKYRIKNQINLFNININGFIAPQFHHFLFLEKKKRSIRGNRLDTVFLFIISFTWSQFELNQDPMVLMKYKI